VNYAVGDRVIKTDGDYTFEGNIVAFKKKSGKIRIVVEDDRGVLMIMNSSQIKKVD
jgi:ABC-type uncharacterized transport system ATPase subunit